MMAAVDAYVAIEFMGANALTALNGQATQDLTQVTTEQAALTAFCDPKGRMVGSGRLCLFEDRVALISPESNANSLLNQLKPFLGLARVTAEITALHVGLQPAKLTLLPGQIQSSDDGWIMGETGNTQWTISNRPVQNSAEAHATRLKAGLGFVRNESRQLCIPQQAHYQMLNGVSFTKGCYTGQEVVARLEHLGESKKTLHIYQGQTPPGVDHTVEIDQHACPVFDWTQTDNGVTALILASNTLVSEKISRVPFEITRQVAGQRPVKR